jgi:hypothetical protein
MAGFQQPRLGAIASAAMIGLALVAIAPWPYATLGGVVANVTMCAIPFMVVVAGFWKGAEPQPIAGLHQPLRGLGLLGLATVFAGAVYAVLSVTFGGGRGDTPFLAFGIILSIVVTFWLDVVLGGWPFALVRNRLLGGASLILAAYLITALLLRTLDFSVFAGQAFYAGMDPAGPIPAWDGLVGGVSCLATVFLFLHFELWPLTLLPRLQRQPVMGVVWSLLILGGGIGGYLFGTRVLGLSPDAFLVTVPVPFMFGTVVVLTMFQGSLTRRLTGLSRGLVSAVLAAVAGTVLARMFLLLQPMLTPDVPASSPLDQHLWLASALLAVTFPLMAMYHDLFRLWPLAGREDEAAPQPGQDGAGSSGEVVADATESSGAAPSVATTRRSAVTNTASTPGAADTLA